MNGLSKRLAAVADFVPAGSRPVDVGTDHAYLPIALVQSGRVETALAADVREGPLERAAEHIAQAGLSDRIQVRLSDGLSQISPGEGDVLVMAGMGGMLMLRILREGSLSGFRKLILAPQSDQEALRRGLMEMALCIEKETLVCEAGKYYPVLCAVHGTDPDADPVRLRYGKALCAEAEPVLASCLAAEHVSLAAALEQAMQNAASETTGRRCEELQKKILLNETAQQRIRREGTWNSASELR